MHSESAARALLFVYGTLMFPEVLLGLLGRVPSSQPATLSGYARHRVSHAPYPAILPADSPGAAVAGLLLEITLPELERLDDYEGEQYLRQEVTVRADSDQGSSACWTYVWDDREDLLLKESWDPEAYDRNLKPR